MYSQKFERLKRELSTPKAQQSPTKSFFPSSLKTAISHSPKSYKIIKRSRLHQGREKNITQTISPLSPSEQIRG